MLAPLLRWIFESAERSPINYDNERAQNVVLQNAKLRVEIQLSTSVKNSVPNIVYF